MGCVGRLMPVLQILRLRRLVFAVALLSPAAAFFDAEPGALFTDDPVNCSKTCRPRPSPLSSTQKNVLVLGDSIASPEIGYFNELERFLGTAVAVKFVSTTLTGVCGTSRGVLACLDGWLAGRTGWDVISMNWGMHDICPTYYRPIPRIEYEANLLIMHAKLAAALNPGGKVLWVSSTPVPPTYSFRNNSDVVDINARAAAIFRYLGVAQDDLCAIPPPPFHCTLHDSVAHGTCTHTHPIAISSYIATFATRAARLAGTRRSSKSVE